MAAMRVIRTIETGEELLVDYGLEYCLRNQMPHPDAEDWARDLTALSLLTRLSNDIASLEHEASEQQVLSGETQMKSSCIKTRLLELMSCLDELQLQELSEARLLMIHRARLYP